MVLPGSFSLLGNLVCRTVLPLVYPPQLWVFCFFLALPTCHLHKSCGASESESLLRVAPGGELLIVGGMFSALTGGAKVVVLIYIPSAVDQNSFCTPFQLTLEVIFLTLIFLGDLNSIGNSAFHILMFEAQLARVGPERWSNILN